MHSHHSIFVALLLLLLSPFLLCSHNEAKIFDGLPVNTAALKKTFDSVVTVVMNCTSETSPSEEKICGGTAISKNAVLTTATCFEFFTVDDACKGAHHNLSISASTTRQKPGDELLFMAHEDNITKHPDYHQQTSGSVDLALVFVGQPLPAHCEINGSLPVTQSDAMFAGWGTIIKGDPDVLELHYQNGTFVDNRASGHKCTDNLPDNIGADVDTWMCILAEVDAGKDYAGPCPDDHGGPVFQTDEDSVLVGVLIPSKMNFCQTSGTTAEGFPALFIGHYLDWIFTEQVKHPLTTPANHTMPAPVLWKPANQTPWAVIWKPANSTHNNTGPSTGPLFFSPFLLGLLTYVQFFVL